jgi:hypothetical protein
MAAEETIRGIELTDTESPAGLHRAEQQVGTGYTDHQQDAIFDRPQECLTVSERRLHAMKGEEPNISQLLQAILNTIWST